VEDGGFYGWPYSYWGQHVDSRVAPQRPIWWRKPSYPATRSAITSPPLRSLSLRGPCFPSASDRAHSLVSMAPGTAILRAASRWCSCRSPTTSPVVIQSMS
jgi:hypothetical protein